MHLSTVWCFIESNTHTIKHGLATAAAGHSTLSLKDAEGYEHGPCLGADNYSCSENTAAMDVVKLHKECDAPVISLDEGVQDTPIGNMMLRVMNTSRTLHTDCTHSSLTKLLQCTRCYNLRLYTQHTVHGTAYNSPYVSSQAPAALCLSLSPPCPFWRCRVR